MQRTKQKDTWLQLELRSLRWSTHENRDGRDRLLVSKSQFLHGIEIRWGMEQGEGCLGATLHPRAVIRDCSGKAVQTTCGPPVSVRLALILFLGKTRYQEPRTVGMLLIL